MYGLSGILPFASVFVVAIQNLSLKEPSQGVLERITMQNIKTNVHYLVNLIGLVATGKTLHLALQCTPEDLFHYRYTAAIATAILIHIPDPPQLLETQTGVVAGVNDIAQELMRILLPPTPKLLGENLQTALNL